MQPQLVYGLCVIIRLNSEMIWKIGQKGKSNIDKILTIWKKDKLNSENMENTEENCEMIWKIWQKMEKI
jgi:hypothetical protein